MNLKPKVAAFAIALILPLASTQAIAVPTQTNLSVTDPTRGLAKAQRQTISLDVWLSSPTAIRVIKKESKGNCKAIGAKGKYRGKWQMNAAFWRSYGGLEFAPRADLATCEQQDQVAYRGWLARGWQPWGIKS